MSERSPATSDVESHWDRLARVHGTTGFTDLRILAFDQRMRIQSVRSLLDEFALHHRSLLDFGCGTGDFLKHLAPRFEKGIGFDTSSQVIGVARSRLRDTRNVTVTSTWNDVGRGFDTILSITVLQHIESASELSGTMSRIAEVTSAGGVCILLESVDVPGLTPVMPHYVHPRTLEVWKKVFLNAGFEWIGSRPFYNPYLLQTTSYDAYRKRTAFAGKVYAILKRAGWNTHMFDTIFRKAAEQLIPESGVPDGFISVDSFSQFMIIRRTAHAH